MQTGTAGKDKLSFLGDCHSDPSVPSLHQSRHSGTLCHSLSLLRKTKDSKGVCSSPLWWLGHLLGAFWLLHCLAPLSAGPFFSVSQPQRRPMHRGAPPLHRTCLTRVGVLHHRGQVPPLVYVHRHEGCVLADHIASLAGVHSIHLVSAIGPWGRKSEGHCWGSESIFGDSGS